MLVRDRHALEQPGVLMNVKPDGVVDESAEEIKQKRKMVDQAKRSQENRKVRYKL